MWRQHQYEEDWERRKAYLIRSLFEDVPVLSPVAEEDESNDSRPSHVLPSSTVVRDPLERPCSPLPPLIIEKEQNKHDEPPEFYRKLEKRIMKYYRKLFIEDLSGISNVSDSTDISPIVAKYCKSVRRASFGEHYPDDSEIAIDEGTRINQSPNWNSMREGFIESKLNEMDLEEEISSSTVLLPKGSTDDEETEKRVSNNYSPKSTPDSTETYIIGNQRSPIKVAIVPVDKETSTMQQDKSSSTDILPKSTSDCEIYEEEDLNSDDQQPGEDTSDADNDMEKMETSSSTTDIDYRQVTFKADVHRDATERAAPTAPSLVYEQGVREGNIDDLHDDNIRLAKLEGNYVSDIENHINSYDDADDDDDNTQPIEVMRTPNMYKSPGSFQNKSNNESQSYDDDDVREISRSLEAHTEYYESSKESSQNKMDFRQSIDFDVLRASMVNRESEVVENNDLNDGYSRKRKCTALRPSPNKIMKYKDASLQANFIEEDLNRRILVDNVFAGVPRVFRLCFCANHLCV